MIGIAGLALAGAALVPVTARQPAASAPSSPVVASVEMRVVAGLLEVEPEAQPLRHDLSAEPPPGLDVSALPEGRWLFGAAPVTKTEALPHAVAADRSRLWFDGDRDGVLEPAEATTPAATMGGIAWFEVAGLVREESDGRVHEARLPMRIGVPLEGDTHAWNRLDCHRRGTLTLDGASTELVVVDRTYRGWFSHLGRDVLLLDVDGDGRIETAPDSHERYRLGRPFPFAGRDLVVRRVAALGTRLEVGLADQPAKVQPSLQVGAPAPAVDAVTTAGTPWRLADQRGHWVLLDFWATWCRPCVAEMPNLKALHAARPDLRIVGLSGDRARAALDAFVARERVDWPQVWDSEGRLQSAYRVASLPRSFLIAPDGTIAARDLRGPQLPRLVADVVARWRASAGAGPKG